MTNKKWASLARFIDDAALECAKEYRNLISDLNKGDEKPMATTTIQEKIKAILLSTNITLGVSSEQLAARVAKDLLAEFDIKEKPEPTVIDRIANAKATIMITTGKQPTTVYLGKKEYTELRQDIHVARAYVATCLTEKDLERKGIIDGLDIYLVDATSHFLVC